MLTLDEIRTFRVAVGASPDDDVTPVPLPALTRRQMLWCWWNEDENTRRVSETGRGHY